MAIIDQHVKIADGTRVEVAGRAGTTLRCIELKPLAGGFRRSIRYDVRFEDGGENRFDCFWVRPIEAATA